MTDKPDIVRFGDHLALRREEIYSIFGSGGVTYVDSISGSRYSLPPSFSIAEALDLWLGSSQAGAAISSVTAENVRVSWYPAKRSGRALATLRGS